MRNDGLHDRRFCMCSSCDGWYEWKIISFQGRMARRGAAEKGMTVKAYLEEQHRVVALLGSLIANPGC